MLHIPSPTAGDLVNDAMADMVKTITCPYCIGRGCNFCDDVGLIEVLNHCPICGRWNDGGFLHCFNCREELIL